MSLLLITFLTALCIAWAITPFVRALALRYGAIDRPDGQRKLQLKPVPLWGGVAIYIAFCTSLLVAAILRQPGQTVPARLTAVLAFSTGLLALVGLLDDTFDLRARSKLFLQFLAASPVVIMGYHPTNLEIFGTSWMAGWLAAPLALIWLVACINAINLLDGLDGFASITGVILAAAITLVALNANNPAAATAAMAITGALLGFLRYNHPPASIYLGDTGSMMIGLVLGELAIFAPDPTGQTVPLLLPLILLAVPLWDMVVAMARRSLRGLSIGSPDREHLHHRLVVRGLSNHQALVAVAGLCLVTSMAGLAVSLWQAETIAGSVIIGLFGLLATFRIVGHVEIQLAFRAVADRIQKFPFRFHIKPVSNEIADDSSVTMILASRQISQNTARSKDIPDRQRAA